MPSSPDWFRRPSPENLTAESRFAKTTKGNDGYHRG